MIKTTTVVVLMWVMLCMGSWAGSDNGGAGGRQNAYGEVAMIKEVRSGAWTPGLTDEEKAVLFAIAEDTLTWCVHGEREPFDLSRYALTPKLKTRMATFVTLKTGDGMLRGCIGSLAPEDELYQSVHNNAILASLRDPRFPPVRPMELPQIKVHISLLSPIAPIGSLDEFKIGEHGIILEKGYNRAVYLPEVAVEQNWTREEALTSLSHKAGLRGDAWMSGAHFKVFSSVVLEK
jgi:AmmeMemoRadiSam system protein A